MPTTPDVLGAGSLSRDKGSPRLPQAPANSGQIQHARHWFKINLTTGLDGRIMKTGGDEPGSRLAFNCDIATPMRRRDTAVYAVDLFADVLVHAGGVTYRVCDLAPAWRSGTAQAAASR